MIGASASQLVDLGFIIVVESHQKTVNVVSAASLLGVWYLKGVGGEQAGKFTFCVHGQGTKQDGPIFVRKTWPSFLYERVGSRKGIRP